MWLQDLTGESNPAHVLAAEQGIARPLIDAALRYQEAYPAEVEARIVSRCAGMKLPQRMHGEASA